MAVMDPITESILAGKIQQQKRELEGVTTLLSALVMKAGGSVTLPLTLTQRLQGGQLNISQDPVTNHITLEYRRKSGLVLPGGE